MAMKLKIHLGRMKTEHLLQQDWWDKITIMLTQRPYCNAYRTISWKYWKYRQFSLYASVTLL